MVNIFEEETIIVITIDIRNTNDFLLFSPEYFKDIGINYIDSYIKLNDNKSEMKKNNDTNNEDLIKTKGGNNDNDNDIDNKKKLTIPYRYFVYLISGNYSNNIKEPENVTQDKKTFFSLINNLFKPKENNSNNSNNNSQKNKFYNPIKNIFKINNKNNLTNNNQSLDLSNKLDNKEQNSNGEESPLVKKLEIENSNYDKEPINKEQPLTLNTGLEKIKYSQMENLENGYQYQIILEIEKDYNDKNVMKLSSYLKKIKYEIKNDVDKFDKSNLSYNDAENIVSDIIKQIHMQIDKNIFIDSISSEGIYIINNKYILLDFNYSDKKIDMCIELLKFIENIIGSDIETIKETIKNTLLYRIITNLQDSRLMEL